MKEQFEDTKIQPPTVAYADDEHFVTLEDSAYEEQAPTRVINLPPPDVEVVSRGFLPTEDLLTETRLRCWELVEQTRFRGRVRVVLTVDLKSSFDDTYTATVSFLEGPLHPKRCGLGADPYEALAHALSFSR